MTPEMMMARSLSSNQEKQKVAAAFEQMSMEELSEFLKTAQEKEDLDPADEKRIKALAKKMRSTEKTANGDMLQYFQDHPEKLKEKQERDAKKKEKKASTVSIADAWGRELAHKEKVAISFNQVNEGSKFVGRASRLWEKHGPAVKNLAGKVGKGARDAFSGAGKRIGNIKDPIARGAALGAATGGVGGAVQGFLDPKEDPNTGKKQRVRTAFRKGLAGAAAGAPTGALFASMSKSSSVRELEKAAAGLPGLGNIGSMARNFVGQMKPMAQKALGGVGNMSHGQMAGVGAAAGSTLGAAKGLMAPGKDAQGNTKSRIGGALKGGIGGAALGAGAGVGLKAMAPRLQASKFLK